MFQLDVLIFLEAKHCWIKPVFGELNPFLVIVIMHDLVINYITFCFLGVCGTESDGQANGMSAQYMKRTESTHRTFILHILQSSGT